MLYLALFVPALLLIYCQLHSSRSAQPFSHYEIEINENAEKLTNQREIV